MTTPMMVCDFSAEERAEMARGKQVRCQGRMRTIPAVNVPRYDEMVAAIERMFPGPEHEHERFAAMETAALYLLGEADAEHVGEELFQARCAYEAATAEARIFVLMAAEDGASEAGLARDLGIDRLTVRKYRGKQDRR